MDNGRKRPHLHFSEAGAEGIQYHQRITFRLLLLPCSIIVSLKNSSSLSEKRLCLSFSLLELTWHRLTHSLCCRSSSRLVILTFCTFLRACLVNTFPFFVPHHSPDLHSFISTALRFDWFKTFPPLIDSQTHSSLLACMNRKFWWFGFSCQSVLWCTTSVD